MEIDKVFIINFYWQQWTKSRELKLIGNKTLLFFSFI